MGDMDSFSHTPVIAKMSIMGAAALKVSARSTFRWNTVQTAAGTRRKNTQTITVLRRPMRWILASKGDKVLDIGCFITVSSRLQNGGDQAGRGHAGDHAQ